MINKTIIQVPSGIRYLGFWKEFNFSNFPYRCIINKQIPGCGFTEFALTCSENVVLCSPRKILLENKKEQHPDTVYLVVNDFEVEDTTDKDVSKPHKITKEDKKDEELQKEFSKDEYSREMFNKLKREIGAYTLNMDSRGLPYKIIVTYDSTYLVMNILQDLGVIGNFWFIVDEFQSIIEDSKFKANTELEFLKSITKLIKLIYVSATPMLDSSISRIPELKDLPYFELDWKTLDPMRVKKPDLRVRTMRSVVEKATEVINSYLEGKFEKAIVERDGQLVEVYSTEAVFYVNCVSNIISIIKKNNLRPDQVNILCAKNRANRRKIQRRLGKEFNIGRVPTRGELHKMFTFCTRTVYLGADFYSLCARSFIFSDSNADCLAVDISIDLPQILGRQRLEENPWHNSATFYYITTRDWRKTSPEEFQKIIDKKMNNTKNLLEAFNSAPESSKYTLANTYLKVVKMENYLDNYVGVDRHSENTLIPQINNLVIINDERAYQIQQVDYADRFSVFCKIEDEFKDVDPINMGIEKCICEFFTPYDQLTTYVDRMKYLCEYSKNHSTDDINVILSNLSDSDKIKQHFIALGPDKIIALCYNLTKINDTIGIITFNYEVLNKNIYLQFKQGEKYTKKNLKEKLQIVYSECGYNVKAKASDIEKWFEVRQCKITLSGKREHCFEIISIKQN